MDLLSEAYSTVSDDDCAAGPGGERPEQRNLINHPHKRIRSETSHAIPAPLPMPVPEAQIPGGYVSKRQRAALSSDPKLPDTNPVSRSLSPVIGNLSDSVLPHDILTTLRRHVKDRVGSTRTPQSISVALNGHAKSVNAVQWSRTQAHLLASAGMDHTVCIWNVWSRDQKRARILNCHHAAVKDVKWSDDGLSVLSCGYDCTSRLVDVENGIELQIFKEDQFVEVVKFLPSNFNLFISGGSKGQLKLWDIRAGKVVHNYVRSLGPILDIEFTVDSKQVITSSDVSKSNLSENAIIVWDVSREVPLSNQGLGHRSISNELN
ncbi:WD repeat-containing protein 25-like [Dorcoceras hygrometricum]|uniref:WD repeat-containing protein 25-like n=1 Tax=Dorcoceras hygrometricum TaxID=472368 RepID=A0A2Z7A077_9LAMI|nr:WD repeat-containing protein 25-like [Dorcoceras hygrometricum]